MNTQGKLSAIYLKHLSLIYSDKLTLTKRESSKLANQMTKFGPREVLQLLNANIDHVSYFAKKELARRNFKVDKITESV